MEHEYDLELETESKPQFNIKSLFRELEELYNPSTLDARGENAFVVAVKFLTLVQNQIDDREESRKLMTAWMKSVRDKDYGKFRRALRRYHRSTLSPGDPELNDLD